MNTSDSISASLQQIVDIYKPLALVALIAAAADWLFVALGMMAAAAAFLGFLLFIAILYALIAPALPTDSDAGKQSE
jgi:Zn-dependent membrane protease YugP